MSEELEIKFKMEMVSTEGSPYVSEAMSQQLATKKELETNEYLYCEEGMKVGDFYLEAEPIPIGLMRNMIQNAEDKGANFVTINWDCDHQEYEVNGLKIERMTNLEIQTKVKVDQEKVEIEKKRKIELLEKELKMLKYKE